MSLLRLIHYLDHFSYDLIVVLLYELHCSSFFSDSSTSQELTIHSMFFIIYIYIYIYISYNLIFHIDSNYSTFSFYVLMKT